MSEVKTKIKLKTKIALIATSIDFTFHSIVYTVKYEKDVSVNLDRAVYCPNDISDKELVLKPTLISLDNMKVCFGLHNLTPQFYQQILNKKIKDYQEYEPELKNIYIIGETVGFILT